MKKYYSTFPQAPWWKIAAFWLQATYWYLFLRPIEKRWQEIEEARNARK